MDLKMKAIVAVKRVVDYNVKVRPKSDGSAVELTNVKMSINPFCEIAVEEAVRLKEKGVVNEIVAVSVGSTQSQEQIRTALALGADRGILVQTEDELEPLAVAKCLEKICNKEEPDLVLLGKQAIDGDNNQTGQMLAALMEVGQATFASEIVFTDDAVTVTREVDGGLQTIKLKMPAVITSDLRLNEPRYASLPNIMKAKKKPIDVIDVNEIGVNVDKRVQTIEVQLPPEREAGIKVENVSELVDKLRNEAKVI